MNNLEPEWQDVKTARKFAELAGHDWEDLSKSVKVRLASRAADMRRVFTDAGREIDKPAAEQAGEPGEALKELAESLSRALMESTESIERSKVWHRIVEATLATELRPLLEKARAVADVHGEKHPTSSVHALAAELGRWEKRS